MKIKETVGIDVGKLSLEVRIHSNQKSREFANTKSDIKKRQDGLKKMLLALKKKFCLSLNIQVYIHSHFQSI